MNKPATKDTTQPEASSMPDQAEVDKTYDLVAELGIGSPMKPQD